MWVLLLCNALIWREQLPRVNGSLLFPSRNRPPSAVVRQFCVVSNTHTHSSRFLQRKKAMHSSSYAARVGSRRPAENLDFDQEAHSLWEKLNLDPAARKVGLWNPLDSIWRHPEGGGTIYVGNQTAAENISLLRWASTDLPTPFNMFFH